MTGGFLWSFGWLRSIKFSFLSKSKLNHSALLQSTCIFSTLCAVLISNYILMHAFGTKTHLTNWTSRTFCLLSCIPQLYCLNPALLYSLRCLVFRGVIWSSSSRYGGRPAGAQHPPGHPETQLPVETRHEHFPGCPGAAGWACQGKATISKHHRESV